MIKAAQGAGVAVPREWAYKRLNIPTPQEGEEVLEPMDAFTAAITEGNPTQGP